jgi:uncharacterized protein (TIGR03067 family)
MRLAVTMIIAVCLLSGADAPKTDAPKKEAASDVKALQGTWRLQSGEADGAAIARKDLRGGRLVIKGDGYTVTLPGKGTVTGTEKLDPAKEPKTIDITDSSGANKGKTCLGIYELKGDEFRVAFAPPGKDRPTEFSTKADSGSWVHVWKRGRQRAK